MLNAEVNSEFNSALSIQHSALLQCQYYATTASRPGLCGPVSSSAPCPSASQTATVDGAELLNDLETLSADAMEGRLPGTPGAAKARAYILRRYKEAGIQPIGDSYERPFVFPRPGRAERPAMASTSSASFAAVASPGRFIVVTAHFDHLGVRNGEIFNGADDNASGVAALLAVAARVGADKPEHSLVFAALDAEESGLNGARAFLSDPPVRARRDRDERQHGHGRPRRQERAVRLGHVPLSVPQGVSQGRGAAAGDAASRARRHRTPRKTTGRRDSDHFPFHEAGIPFIYFGVEDEAQHHKATDDAETVTKEFFVGAANTILAAVRQFDANLETISARR